MFKMIRIIVLLLVLVIVAGNAWLTKLRSTSWEIPLEAVIYPVNGDGSRGADDYISALDPDVFQPVVRYMAHEGKEFGVALDRPVTVEIAPRVNSLPPRAPFGGNVLQIILWSLKIRWWAWRADTYDGYEPGTGLPVYPAGYAEPDLSPLYPQKLAEIMGGTIPISENEAAMPESLAKTIIGPLTAGEIGWGMISD